MGFRQNREIALQLARRQPGGVAIIAARTDDRPQFLRRQPGKIRMTKRG